MDLTLGQILLLAVVQGVAEFLPISSSGHVVIVASMLAPEDRSNLDIVDVNIALHMGTLFSILVVYFRRIIGLVFEDARLIGPLVVATLPAVLVGLTIERWFEDVLENPLLAGVCLILTGAMLVLASNKKPTSVQEDEAPSYLHALIIGIFQAIAILPGISRSGSTISAGLMLGLSPPRAATFSFLMAIPVIGGAGLLKIVSLATALPEEASEQTPIQLLLIGAVVSFVVGIGALVWLIRWLEKGRFHWFAWWCIPIGVTVVVWQLVG